MKGRKMKKQISTCGKQSFATQQALVSFLSLLNRVSKPGVAEFCTPGHKAGRGFRAMLLPGLPPSVPFPILEEV